MAEVILVFSEPLCRRWSSVQRASVRPPVREHLGKAGLNSRRPIASNSEQLGKPLNRIAITAAIPLILTLIVSAS